MKRFTSAIAFAATTLSSQVSGDQDLAVGRLLQQASSGASYVTQDAFEDFKDTFNKSFILLKEENDFLRDSLKANDRREKSAAQRKNP